MIIAFILGMFIGASLGVLLMAILVAGERGGAMRDLLLQFICSLTLCDHMGDVSDDIDVVLKRLGLDIEWYELTELFDILAEMGIFTLWGDVRE